MKKFYLFFFTLFIIICSSNVYAIWPFKKKIKHQPSIKDNKSEFITIEESDIESITFNKKYIKYVIHTDKKLLFLIDGDQTPIEFIFNSAQKARKIKKLFFGESSAEIEKNK